MTYDALILYLILYDVQMLSQNFPLITLWCKIIPNMECMWKICETMHTLMPVILATIIMVLVLEFMEELVRNLKFSSSFNNFMAS